MPHQIISEILFLTGFKVYDITMIWYVTFDYVTTDAIDCLHFHTIFSSNQVNFNDIDRITNKKISDVILRICLRFLCLLLTNCVYTRISARLEVLFVSIALAITLGF